MKPIVEGVLLAGRFEVLRSLGSGGLAEVFAARDRQTGQDVAVKVLHPHLTRAEGMRERFRRELGVTRGLSHPGIVRVFDLHEHDGAPFFTMELLEGETLGGLLARGPVEALEARRIVRELAAALEVAHAAGVVHRDLKPQNVFLTKSGQVKLLDFGLARVVGQARLTATSTVMGTPGYLAPEVLQGAVADARADVYALGATWYALLTGRGPFSGLDPAQVLRAQQGTAPSARADKPEVPAADDRLLQRALASDPERRFLDARQFSKALGGEVVPERPAPLPGLVAGEFDVHLHQTGLFPTRETRVLERLGFGRAPLSWVRGGTLVVSGASRDSALALTEALRGHGLISFLRPTPRSHHPVLQWLRRSPRAGGLAVGALGLAVGATTFMLIHQPSDPLPATLVVVLIGTLLAALCGSAAGGLGARHIPLRTALPRGDPAIWRLLQGIVDRLRGLRERLATSRPSAQLLAAELLTAAGEAVHAATHLATTLSQQPAGSFAGPDEPTLPHGAALPADVRDRGVSRLLTLAATLDEALAALDAPASSLEGLAADLRKARAGLHEASGPLALPGEV